MSIPVFVAGQREGALPDLLRQAHEARVKAFHAIAEAGTALGNGSLEVAEDAFQELITLAEDGAWALYKFRTGGPRISAD